MASSRRKIRVTDLSQRVREELAEAGIEVEETAHKFKAAPKADRTHEGVVFGSRLEMNIYIELARLFPDTHIHRQFAFELLPAFEDSAGRKRQAVTYVADFVISSRIPSSVDKLAPDQFVIDAKGMPTPIFMLKEKWFAYHFGTVIIAVKSVRELYATLLAAKLIAPCNLPTKLQKLLLTPSKLDAPSLSGAMSQTLEKLLTTRSAS